jgi:hypothetical protein
MKNKIVFAFVFVLLFSFHSKVLAGELCSSNGYTILTINGINTNKDGAIENKDKLRDHISQGYFNNQPLKVDFLYNQTHLGGLGDLIDTVAQGAFDKKSDYDLTEMLNDASQKVTTQKVLLVAHSQGNFYSNNFYEKVASEPGGIPEQSIGVYGVASPADYVAGGGEYVTSDTDKIINKVAGRIFQTLPPNIHIALQDGDDKDGHSFSDVYLKYQGARIVSDIKSSLGKLQNNDEQASDYPCISPPDFSFSHEAGGLALNTADSIINGTKNAVVFVIDGTRYIATAIGNSFNNIGLALGNMFGNLSANVVQSLPDTNSLTTILPGVLNNQNEIKKDTKPKYTIQNTPTETVVTLSAKNAEEIFNNFTDSSQPIFSFGPVVSGFTLKKEKV